MTRRSALAVALAAWVALAMSACIAAAQTQAGRWTTRFDRKTGETAADFRSANGGRLSLICDSAGPRPGRGRIEVAFPLAPPVTAFPASVELTVGFGARSLSHRAAALTVTEPPQRGGGTTPALTLFALIPVDGSAASALAMREIVALIQQGGANIGVQATPPGVSFTIRGGSQERALKSFAEGCQNFLPSADDEIIWDWHQGLDSIDGRATVTLVTQPVADDTREDAQRLTIACRDEQISVTIGGLSPPLPPADALAIAQAEPARLRSAPAGAPHAVTIAREDIPVLLAQLSRSDRLILTRTDRAAAAPIEFPVAGFALAARRLRALCPAPFDGI